MQSDRDERRSKRDEGAKIGDEGASGHSEKRALRSALCCGLHAVWQGEPGPKDKKCRAGPLRSMPLN